MDIFKKNERKRKYGTTSAAPKHERWVWNALDVKSRYHLVSIAGPRSQEKAREVIEVIKEYTTEIPPIYITDGFLAYKNAIYDAYLAPIPPFGSKKLQKHFVYGLTILPEHYQPVEITHIRVIKHQTPVTAIQPAKPVIQITQGGVEIDTARYQAQNIAIGCHTNYIERRQFTQRRHSAVLHRKSSAVTHNDECLQDQLTLERLYYNFVLTHRSLREETPIEQKRWKKVTPAMKLGITDHVWTFKEFITNSISVTPFAQQPRKNTPAHKLPKPSLVSIRLKDEVDSKILQLLNNYSNMGLTRTQIYQQIKQPRTTVFDRLVVLEDKALIVKSYKRLKRRGRPALKYHLLWNRLSISHSKEKDYSAIVSNINR